MLLFFALMEKFCCYGISVNVRKGKLRLFLSFTCLLTAMPLTVFNKGRVWQGCTFCFLTFLGPKWAALKPDFASAEVSVIGEVGWIPRSKYSFIVVIKIHLLWQMLNRSGGSVRVKSGFLFQFFFTIFTLIPIFLNNKKFILEFQYELVPCSVKIF